MKRTAAFLHAGLIVGLAGLIVGLVLVTLAQPAQCDDCLTAGMPCFNESACGRGCECYLPDGIGRQGFCG